MMLSGCAGSGTYFQNKRLEMAEVPADLQTCFDNLVGMPTGAMTKKQVMNLLLEVRRSELEKSQCGKRLLKWVDGYRGKQ